MSKFKPGDHYTNGRSVVYLGALLPRDRWLGQVWTDSTTETVREWLHGDALAKRLRGFRLLSSDEVRSWRAAGTMPRMPCEHGCDNGRLPCVCEGSGVEGDGRCSACDGAGSRACGCGGGDE